MVARTTGSRVIATATLTSGMSMPAMPMLRRNGTGRATSRGATEDDCLAGVLHGADDGRLARGGTALPLLTPAHDDQKRDSVQDAYIYGFALQETDMSSEAPEDFAAEAQRQMREYEAVLADDPHLVEVVGGYVAKSGYDYATEFLFGLDVILDGLGRLLDPD